MQGLVLVLVLALHLLIATLKSTWGWINYQIRLNVVVECKTCSAPNSKYIIWMLRTHEDSGLLLTEHRVKLINRRNLTNWPCPPKFRSLMVSGRAWNVGTESVFAPGGPVPLCPISISVYLRISVNPATWTPIGRQFVPLTDSFDWRIRKKV